MIVIIARQGRFWTGILRTQILIFDMSLGSFGGREKAQTVLIPNPAFKSCLQSTEALGFLIKEGSARETQTFLNVSFTWKL